MKNQVLPATGRCTCFRVRKLTRLMSQRYDRKLSGAGFTLNQYSILRRLGDASRTVGDLARELGMDRTTLSRDLKPLLACEWLEQVSTEDARQRPVRVSNAGKRALAKAAPAWREAQDEIEELLGATGIQALHVQLDRAIGHLQQETP
jgi:DNA-binding MarR family transcriptional regulator